MKREGKLLLNTLCQTVVQVIALQGAAMSFDELVAAMREYSDATPPKIMQALVLLQSLGEVIRCDADLFWLCEWEDSIFNPDEVDDDHA